MHVTHSSVRKKTPQCCRLPEEAYENCKRVDRYATIISLWDDVSNIAQYNYIQHACTNRKKKEKTDSFSTRLYACVFVGEIHADIKAIIKYTVLC
jgi:hypothetical protein